MKSFYLMCLSVSSEIGNFELDIKEIKAVHKVPRDVERKLFSRRQ